MFLFTQTHIHAHVINNHKHVCNNNAKQMMIRLHNEYTYIYIMIQRYTNTGNENIWHILIILMTNQKHGHAASLASKEVIAALDGASSICNLASGLVFMPIPSMYGICTYIWLILMVNAGKYTIHGCNGILNPQAVAPSNEFSMDMNL